MTFVFPKLNILTATATTDWGLVEVDFIYQNGLANDILPMYQQRRPQYDQQTGRSSCSKKGGFVVLFWLRCTSREALLHIWGLPMFVVKFAGEHQGIVAKRTQSFCQSFLAHTKTPTNPHGHLKIVKTGFPSSHVHIYDPNECPRPV